MAARVEATRGDGATQGLQVGEHQRDRAGLREGGDLASRTGQVGDVLGAQRLMVGLPEPVQTGRRLARGEPRAGVAVGNDLSRLLPAGLRVAAQRQPRPGDRFVARHEQRPAATAECFGQRGGEAIQARQPLSALGAFGHPRQQAQVILAEPVPDDGLRLGQVDVRSTVVQQRTDPQAARRVLAEFRKFAVTSRTQLARVLLTANPAVS
jgi:hypothetical protein